MSEHVSWIIAGLFAWLFRPLLLISAVTAFLVAEVWIFARQNTGLAMARVMANPGGILVVVGLSLASAAFHEIGHAAACRYGKVRPGAMGCGIYLVWPGFYTDVTNSYRLSRSGRLRTDLGGVYFNGLFILGLVAVYLQTQSPVVLVAILLINLEVVQQLLPTLRFDGYTSGPSCAARSCGARRRSDSRPLKRWPQVVVTIWVLAVLPALTLQLGFVIHRLPQMVTTARGAASTLVTTATTGATPVLSTASACVQILFLLLPPARHRSDPVATGQLADPAGPQALRRPRAPRQRVLAAHSVDAAVGCGCRRRHPRSRLPVVDAGPPRGTARHRPRGVPQRRHRRGADGPLESPPAEVRPPVRTPPPSEPTSVGQGRVTIRHTGGAPAEAQPTPNRPAACRKHPPQRPAGKKHRPPPTAAVKHQLLPTAPCCNSWMPLQPGSPLSPECPGSR